VPAQDLEASMTPQRFDRTLEIAAEILGLIAIAFWWTTCGFVMSWTGHRPLEPDPATGDIYPFNNHGIMYVSSSDLFWWHFGLFISIGVFAAAVLCQAARKRLAARSQSAASPGTDSW
jgi:hypothetical protein